MRVESGLIATSASVMLPLLSKMTLAFPGLCPCPPKNVRLAGVSAMVIRLTPSVPTSWLGLLVTLNWMFAACDQCASARRAASVACALVAWTNDGGLVNRSEEHTSELQSHSF